MMSPYMKPDIHPPYHRPVYVTCVCGTTFATGSTQAAIKVEICSACHPFYTGKHKLVDVAGRLDKFRQRLKEKEDLGQKRLAQAAKPKKKATKKIQVTRLS